jgi:hypothetical protein
MKALACFHPLKFGESLSCSGRCLLMKKTSGNGAKGSLAKCEKLLCKFFIVFARWDVNINRPQKFRCFVKEKTQARKIVGYIYRPYRTLKNGVKLWAYRYGLKAWRIPVYED